MLIVPEKIAYSVDRKTVNVRSAAIDDSVNFRHIVAPHVFTSPRKRVKKDMQKNLVSQIDCENANKLHENVFVHCEKKSGSERNRRSRKKKREEKKQCEEEIAKAERTHRYHIVCADINIINHRQR